MARRILAFLACLAVVPVTSCGGPAPPAVPVAPTCSVESARQLKLDDSTELRVWNLKASGLKRLTARLLVATDGKVQPFTEVEYKWPAWKPDAPAASGQLVLLLQDGRAFGVPGKRLPLLGANIEGSPSYSRTEKKTRRLLEGELHSRMSTSSNGTPLGRQGVLYAELFLPKPDAPGAFSLGSDVESLAASSRNGATVLAVTLEWDSRE